MFKLTVEYPNFLGEKKEETFRFNFSEDELLNLAKDDPEFNADYIAVLMKEERLMGMYMLLRKLVLFSYGEMSDDAKYFRKSEEKRSDFRQSAAFDAVIDKFVGPGSEDLMKAFIYNVFPAKFAEELKKKTQAAQLEVVK